MKPEMNERKQQSIPAGQNPTDSRTSVADSICDFLGLYRERISIVNIGGDDSDPSRNVPRRNQSTSEKRFPITTTVAPTFNRKRAGNRIKCLLAIIAASYLVIAVANPQTAANVWAPYAIIVFILALTNILLDKGCD